MSAKHASSEYWDRYFAAHNAAGTDLDWGGRWTEPFLPWLRSSRARKVLELGCGTGNDAARLAASGFEAVMANVSLHMFSDEVTRRVFAEIGRVACERGLLLVHVNSDADRPLRAIRRPVARELEPNYVLEAGGQTVRFFSRAYLLDLLEAWSIEELEHVEIADEESGAPFKRVWRVVARR